MFVCPGAGVSVFGWKRVFFCSAFVRPCVRRCVRALCENYLGFYGLYARTVGFCGFSLSVHKSSVKTYISILTGILR